MRRAPTLRAKAWRSLLPALALAAVATAAPAQEKVSFPSLDGGASPVVLTALWFPATAPAPPSPAAIASAVASAAAAGSAPATLPPPVAAVAPAVALFHGCGGAFDRRGQLAQRMQSYAALFNKAGYGVLVVDSLTPRYEVELCTQRIGSRRVTQANRRLDALGAIAYLAGRADVDPKRIGIVGWSNGGSTVLAVTNLRHRDVAQALTQPAFAVAFYPGCDADLKRGYEAAVPLLMLVGQADDWTPAAPCRALQRDATGAARPELVAYPGAYHGFDGEPPVRLRKDVPGGANPGQGVHVGGNAAAWKASQERLLEFVGRY